MLSRYQVMRLWGPTVDVCLTLLEWGPFSGVENLASRIFQEHSPLFPQLPLALTDSSKTAQVGYTILSHFLLSKGFRMACLVSA